MSDSRWLPRVVPDAPAEKPPFGFVTDSEPLTPAVGLALEPASPATHVMSFRCGAGEQVVNGSMIGTLAADKMSAAPILQFRLAAGHQIPEAFEGQAPGTLATTTSAGTEQSALSGKLRISAEEPSEIKARAF